MKKDNEILKAKNNEIIPQNKKLLAKLNNLESMASKFQSTSKMISINTKEKFQATRDMFF